MNENSTEIDNRLDVVIKAEKQFFYSSESDFGIFACVIARETKDSEKIVINNFGNFTVKGSMPILEPGKQYKAKVIPKDDKKFGLGYEVVSIYEEVPTTKEAQKKFLSALLTEKQVDEIFNAYPDTDVINLIEEGKFDHSIVKGLGDKTFEKVKDKVLKNLEYREAIIQLSEEYGISFNMIKRMSDSYGSPTLLIQKIKEDPYILSYDVDGIGFKKADAIALRHGIEKDSPKRISACILFILDEQANSGHTWVSRNKLSAKVAEELGLRMKMVTDFIKDVPTNAQINKKVYIDDKRVALEKNRKAEESVASHIKRLLEIEDNYIIPDIQARVDEAERNQGFDFTDEQREAIELAIKKNVIVINGKAGTGKTSVLKGVLNVLMGQEGLTYITCALSGKASQRIQESTGLDSSTMHRALAYNPKMGGFQHNEYEPMPYDIIVLDEASMVNSYLMSKLVCAVKDGAKLIILGDTAQLEPIGVGNCLLDLIKSGEVPRVELTIVHRQAQKSGILSVANGVREGKQFTKSNDFSKRKLGELKDLMFYPYKDAETVYQSVLQIAKGYASSGGSILDFQVIVPMKTRGDLSTFNINQALQDIFNPSTEDKQSIVRGKIEFREGDKVIQNGNNYDVNVFNGTIGIIEFIDIVKKIMVINFEGVGRVEYKSDELSQIDHAYALTVHRTQGSQWKNVVVAFDYSSYVLLSRQLVYTALTRAIKVCFLPVQLSALIHAIKTDKSSERNTFLVDMLE